MASVNKVILVGHLGRDPEVRYLPSGDPVTNFSLATSEQWKDRSGAKQERTEWHQVEVFGKAAEVVGKYCQKGSKVYIEGSITYQEWTDKENVKRTKAKIKVSGFNSRVVLMDSKGGRSEESDSREPANHAPGANNFDVSDDDLAF